MKALIAIIVVSCVLIALGYSVLKLLEFVLSLW